MLNKEQSVNPNQNTITVSRNAFCGSCLILQGHAKNTKHIPNNARNHHRRINIIPGPGNSSWVVLCMSCDQLTSDVYIFTRPFLLLTR